MRRGWRQMTFGLLALPALAPPLQAPAAPPGDSSPSPSTSRSSWATTPEQSQQLESRAAQAFAKAEQALAAGKIAEADTLLRVVLRAAPDHDRAAAMLRSLYANHGLALEPDHTLFEATKAQLPEHLGQFNTYETPAFIVLSNAPNRWSQERTHLLTAAMHQYARVMDKLGLEAIPPERKLLCVLIDEYGDYERFAAEHDLVQAPWVAGYYASLTNRVVMYRDETGPGYQRVAGQLSALDEQAREATRDARSAPQEQRERKAQYAQVLAQHAKGERERIESEIQQIADAKAIHEAIHLIAFNCGLQSRSHQYPFWLTEGLATNFETDNHRAKFGPDQPYGPRELAFAEALEAGELLPVRTLVGLHDIHDVDSDRARVVYAQSYALFRYLFRFHRERLAAMFREVQALPPGEQEAGVLLEVFTRVVGEPEAIEAMWLRHESRNAAAVLADAQE